MIWLIFLEALTDSTFIYKMAYTIKSRPQKIEIDPPVIVWNLVVAFIDKVGDTPNKSNF